MALSATFTANFASFYDAVDKADAKLKDFGSGADKVGGRLNTLANQFSGQKIVQEATLMAKAVEEIGGVSKLTDKELARLGSTANEAVAKMKALGMDVPKNLQEIADKTKGANKATTDWMGSITKIAATMGIAFSLDAIKGFIGSVFDAAGAVKDLSDQWGVSTTFVQQWSAAAKQSGVESEQLGKSIQYMTEKLSEASPEYAALLKNIGLSSDALRKMSTEDAYKEVIKAIAGIKDETLQLDVAMGILGPNAKKIIGGIRDGMYEAADAQKVMSDETIKRLEAAGDAWERFKNNVVIYSGEMLARIMDDTARMTSSWGSFFKYLSAAAQGPGAVAMLLEQDRALAKLGTTMKGVVTTTETFTVAGATLTNGMKTTAQILEEQRKKEEALKKAQEDRTKALADAKSREEEYIKSLRAHNDAVLALVNTLEGGDLIGKANLYLEALRDSIPVQQMTAKEQANINQVMGDALEVYRAAGVSAPDAMNEIWLATLKVDQAFLQLGKTSGLLEKSLPIISGIQIPDIGQTVPLSAPPKVPVNQINEALKAVNLLTAAFADLGQVSGGAFGEITEDLAIVVDAMNHARASTQTLQSGIKSFQAGNLTQGFAQSAAGAAGIISSFQSATKETGKLQSTLNGAAIGFSVGGPWGAAVGAGIGLLKGFFNASKQAKEVRNLREDFIAASGGAEALRLEAEKADVSLTTLFAAKNKTDLEASIKTIEEALKFQADAYDLAIQTAQKYGFTIEELGPAMARQELDKQAQQLFKDWEVLNSAGIDTIAISDKMSQSVSEYVQHASKMGTEIPAAMRPMLEAMAKSGDLLDENGNAITDLEDAGLSFSMTMSEGFKSLIDEVHKLTDAISRSLTDAIKDVPPINVPVADSYAEYIKTHPGARAPGYAEGTGGFVNFGKGTPVVLHGWEAVVPRDEAASGAFATVNGPVAAAPAAAFSPSIVINAQGAFFDTPGDLQRLADRVNDALTAKFSLSNAMRAG